MELETGHAMNNGFQELKFRAGGFLTRCLVAGPEDGEVLLLLHDAAFGGASDVSWKALIPILSQNYRVIAPDLLGFGGSDKAIFVDRSPYDFRISHILSVLDVLAIDGKVHAIGSSFGGSMALHMLRRHADRLVSVASIAGAGGGWRTDFGRQILGHWDGTRQGLAKIVAVLADGNEEFDIEAHLDQRFYWACKEGHYRAVVAPSTLLPEALVSKVTRNPFPPVADSSVPVLLIAGLRDKLIERDWPQKLSALLPGKCSVEEMDAKHSPNLDRPADLSNVLTRWLASNGKG